MRIEAIDFYYLSMPEVLDIGDGSQDALVVRVAGGGLVGWGECEASPLVSIAALVCPMSHGACKPVSASELRRTQRTSTPPSASLLSANRPNSSLPAHPNNRGETPHRRNAKAQFAATPPQCNSRRGAKHSEPGSGHALTRPMMSTLMSQKTRMSSWPRFCLRMARNLSTCQPTEGQRSRRSGSTNL